MSTQQVPQGSGAATEAGAGLGDRFRSEDGVAMVATLGLVMVITALMVVAVVTSTSALRSSRDHVAFEQSLAAAEAGVDANLAELSEAFAAGNPGWTNPAPCALPAPTAADVATEDAERAWAQARLSALPASCKVATPQGDYVAGRAPGRQVVYSLGTSGPVGAAGTKDRLLKAEYVFAPYKPGKALLTDGDLDFTGSVAINNLDPSLPADVHTNDSVSGINPSTNVSGSITATGMLSGSCSNVAGGCLAGQPVEPISSIVPRTVWRALAPGDPNWVDLCPLGVAKRPGPTDPIPCMGTVVSPGPWVYSLSGGISTWTYPRTSSNVPGAYYVFFGNAVVGDSGHSADVRQISVFAEPRPVGGGAATCGKLGGDITWKLFNLQPYVEGTALFAGGSLYGSANADAGPGLFQANDHIEMSTSSSTITGSIVANNMCAAAGTNEVQGVTIRYDATVEGPVNDIIRTTLWLEY